MLRTQLLITLWLLVTIASEAPSPPAAPLANGLPAPPPPPPALAAGLRALLLDTACDVPCRERAEDWFEQAAKWGAHNVVSMVRLGLEDNFLGALALSEDNLRELRRRLSKVSTTLAPVHSEL